MDILKLTVLAFAILGPVSAQWLRYPTSGIQRTADGKPNLSAPAPKMPGGKPDLLGIWVTADGGYLPNIAKDGVEVPMLPWAAALYKERQANHAWAGHRSAASLMASQTSTRWARPADSCRLPTFS
jgi:hypothetical protein